MKMILPMVLLLGCASISPGAKATLTLPTLIGNCALERTWVGLVPRMPEGIILKCGEIAFLVSSPSNLYRHVSLRSSADALQFVRLFTAPDTYRFFELQGMVELVPGQVTDTSDFNVVDANVFARRLTAATAREITSAGEKERTFHVTRTVVLEQKVYEIDEIVTHNGIYSLLSKRELVDDASVIGVIHAGEP